MSKQDKKQNKKLVRLRGQDWEALYDKDTGDLITEDHMINYDDVLAYLGVEVESVFHTQWFNWPENNYDCAPKSLGEVLEQSRREENGEEALKNGDWERFRGAEE